MVVDLAAARAGLRPASGGAARDDGTATAGVLLAHADYRRGAAPSRGWRVALATALGRLPSGARLTITDSDGREWDVAPAVQARVASFREVA
jgi:hypothetical protein